MKKILAILIVAFIGITVISCGGHNKKKDETKNKNIVADSLSPEIAVLNAKIKATPDNPDLYNERAKLLLDKQKLDEAFADIGTALKYDSSKAEYFLTLSDIYFAKGRIKNCKASIEKALTLNPKYADADLKLAELNLYNKDYKKTMEFINKAIDIDKVNAKAYFMKGMTLKEMGDTTKAVSSFQTAVSQDPEYHNAYIQLGLLYSIKHSLLAVDYFNNALRCNPKSIEARYGLGMFYQGNEEYNKAIAEYDSILRIDPKFKTAHYNLGYINLVFLKEFPEAIKHFTDAILCDPKYAEAYYNRGYCYELMGDFNNAKTNYDKALEIRPNYQRPIDGLNRIEKPKH